MPKCQSCGTGVAQEFQHYKSGVWQCSHNPDAPDWQQTIINMIGTENATGSVMNKLGQIERLLTTTGSSSTYTEAAFKELSALVRKHDEGHYKKLYEDYKELLERAATSRDWWKTRCEILEEKLEEERALARQRRHWWQRRKVSEGRQ